MKSLEEALEAIFDATQVVETRVPVKKEDLTEEEKAQFLFVFGHEAFSQTKIFLVERT